MGKKLIGMMICALAVTLILEGSVTNGATTFTVGDSLGWTVPPNNSLNFYQNWASNHSFQIGDSLLFNWTGTHTVVEVPDKILYDNCTLIGLVFASSGISTLLSQNGTRYFLCSDGTHCQQGMKLSVKIGDGIPPSSSATPPSLQVASLAAILLFSFAIIILFTHV